MILPRAFYDRPTLDVARELVGKVLVHRTRGVVSSGRIVEVEAYIGESDPACHAAVGRTRRNAPLYGAPGFSYVYLNYGIHHLVNAVTEPIDSPAAVLIRALEPVEGIRAMRRRRHLPTKGRRRLAGGSIADIDLCKGPGNLTQAMGIHLVHSELDLSSSDLFIEDAGGPSPALLWGPRIGIRVGTDRLWRAWIAGHASVSAPRQSSLGRPDVSLNA